MEPGASWWESTHIEDAERGTNTEVVLPSASALVSRALCLPIRDLSESRKQRILGNVILAILRVQRQGIDLRVKKCMSSTGIWKMLTFPLWKLILLVLLYSKTLLFPLCSGSLVYKGNSYDIYCFSFPNSLIFSSDKLKCICCIYFYQSLCIFIVFIFLAMQIFICWYLFIFKKILVTGSHFHWGI